MKFGDRPDLVELFPDGSVISVRVQEFDYGDGPHPVGIEVRATDGRRHTVRVARDDLDKAVEVLKGCLND